MFRQWFLVILSVLALIGGFIMVLIFTKIYALPNLVIGEFDPAVCRTTQVYVDPCACKYDTQCSTEDGPTHGHIKCSTINVSYYALSGRYQKATLYYDYWSYKQTDSGNHKCFCVGSCDVTCSNSSRVLLINGYNVSKGSTFTCYYNPENKTEVVMHRLSTAVVMNAMIWPSVLFIIGFVSLVFSCIRLQKEGFDCCNCRTQQLVCSTEYVNADTVMVI